jgi:hypothetical protein
MSESLFNFADTSSIGKDEWLTPPGLVKAIGPFDLDPCGPVKRPWETASKTFTCHDGGLSKAWDGFVWLNPPYSTAGKWFGKLAGHDGGGFALIFARTETSAFHEHVWGKAQALFFFAGRLRFHHVSGEIGAAAPAPSVLVAYGAIAAERIGRVAEFQAGKLVRL